jgi:MFS family permease
MFDGLSQRKTKSGIGVATLIVSSTTVVSHSFARSSYGLLIPAIEDSLDITHAQAGFGGTMTYGAFLIGTLIVASISGRTEPVNLMRAGLIIATVGFGINAVAPNYPVLLLGLAVGGGAGAGIWIPAPTVATAGVSPERRSFVIGLLTATIGVGILTVGVGTNVIRAVFDDDGLWRPVWALQAFIAFVLFLLMVTVVRQERTPAVDSSGMNLSLLRTVPSWWQITLAYSLYAIAGGGFFAFVIAAVEQDGGLGRGDATAVFAAMGLAGAVAAPLTGRLSDRFGRRPVMLGSVAAVATAASAVAFGGREAVVAGAVLFGSIAGSFPTQVATYVRDHAEARVFAGAFATMLLFFSVAAIVAPTLMGWLADETGSFTVPYATIAAIAMVIIAIVLRLPESANQLSSSSPTSELTRPGGERSTRARG